MPKKPLTDAVRQIFWVMVERFDRNNILTYASAMAVQLLTAVIPLALVAFLLVGWAGEQDVWRIEIGPTFAAHASVATYQGVDAVVEGLIAKLHTQWLVLATLIAIWEISGAVRTVIGGLNCIFGLDEERSIWRRFGLSFVLAVVVGVLVLAALLIAVRGGGWVSLGAAQAVWSAARFLAVAVLLWLATATLLRFAPDGERSGGWVTVGAVVVVAAWFATSFVFGWWVTSIANYTTPFGTAIALLTLIGYLYTSSIVFLVGAQVDQLLLEQSRNPDSGPLTGIV